MTDTAENADLARAAALAALLTGTPAGEAAAEPPVLPTGREVYAGGTVRRFLKHHASIQYPTDDKPPVLQRAVAVPGDIVLLPEGEAARLDSLGATIDEADLDTPTPVEADIRDDGTWSDAKLAGANVSDIAAYVGQHPDERPRVRTVEEAKTKPRAGVLSATEPTPEADAERAAQVAAKAAEDAAAQQAAVDAAAEQAREAQEAAEAAKAEQDAADALAQLAGGK